MYKTEGYFVHASNQETPKLLFTDDCIQTVHQHNATPKIKLGQESQKVSLAWTSIKKLSKTSMCRYQVETEISISYFHR